MREDKARPRPAKMRTRAKKAVAERHDVRQQWWFECMRRFDDLCSQKKIGRHGLQTAVEPIGGRHFSQRHFRRILGGNFCPIDPQVWIRALAKMVSLRDGGDDKDQADREREYYERIAENEALSGSTSSHPDRKISKHAVASSSRLADYDVPGRDNRGARKREDLFEDKELVSIVITSAIPHTNRLRLLLRKTVSYFGVVGSEIVIDRHTVQIEMYITLGRNFAQQVGRMVADVKRIEGVKDAITL